MYLYFVIVFIVNILFEGLNKVLLKVVVSNLKSGLTFVNNVNKPLMSKAW